jgi:putative peptide zinc metalloprotease protein
LGVAPLSTVFGRKRLVAAARPEEGARALADRHGPPDDRPGLRKDLRIRRQVQLGEQVWIVKDPVEMAYYQFKRGQWALIQLFNGERTRLRILEEFNRRTPDHPIDMSAVLEAEEALRGMDLIEQSVAERSLMLLDRFRTFREKQAEEKSEGFNVFFIKFHVLDPNGFLDRTVKYVRWLWTPPVVVATLIASAWTVGVFVNNWEPIWTGTLDLYHFVGKPLLDVLHFFVILCIIGAIHEYSHAYVTKIYGGEVHDIGFVLFYFTPAFYCNTSDSYLFPSRWQRLWVTTAGIYVEAIICSLATLLWVSSYPDSFLHAFAYKTMLLTGVSTIFFNINPLIKVDGYYALSSILQLQDLRESSFRLWTALFQRYVLRLPMNLPLMSRHKRRVCLLYGFLAMVYTTSVMILIGKLFNNLYSKYFPDFATVLLILTLYYIFRKRVRKAVRVGKMFYLDKKELFMSRRSRLPLAGLAALLFVVLAVPWSHGTIRAESFLRPSKEARVEAPENGVVREVLVHEGDTIDEGASLFRMESPLVEEATQLSSVEKERFERRSGAGRSTANATAAFQSGLREVAAVASSRSAASRRRFLEVRSPIRGRVLTSRTEDLEGRNVPAGFALARIGDCRKMVADVAVPERLLEYLEPGSAVIARARTRPMRSMVGSVAAISPAALPEDTTTPNRASNIPPESANHFVVQVIFENSDESLVPGGEASVKIRAARQSYGLRAWNASWRWFRARVW